MIMIKYSWNGITRVSITAAAVETKWGHQYLSGTLASLLQVQQLISTQPRCHTSVSATATNNSRKGGPGSQLVGASGRDQSNLQPEKPLGSQRKRSTAPWEEQWLDSTLQHILRLMSSESLLKSSDRLQWAFPCWSWAGAYFLVYRYGGVNKKCLPEAHVLEHLVPSEWNCLGRLWNV